MHTIVLSWHRNLEDTYRDLIFLQARCCQKSINGKSPHFCYICKQATSSQHPLVQSDLGTRDGTHAEKQQCRATPAHTETERAASQCRIQKGGVLQERAIGALPAPLPAAQRDPAVASASTPRSPPHQSPPTAAGRKGRHRSREASRGARAPRSASSPCRRPRVRQSHRRDPSSEQQAAAATQSERTGAAT